MTLSTYPLDKHGYIIDLMKRFELCYELDSEMILVPDLLDIQEPTFDFDYETALKFQIDYDFLPRSIMARFIVKMNKDIKDELQWRTGVVLEHKKFKCTAIVKADNEAKRIGIWVNGEQKRDYFAVVLFNLREITESFEKLKAVERVPLPDEPRVAVSYNHLLTLEKMGIEDFVPDGATRRYKVEDLLGSIGIKTEREIIDEIWVIYNKNQTKLYHNTRRDKPFSDPHLKTSMFGAVQMFIDDVEKEEEGYLDEMKYGHIQYLIERGSFITIVVIGQGEHFKARRKRIRSVLQKIERDHADELENWEGYEDDVEFLKDYVEDVLV